MTPIKTFLNPRSVALGLYLAGLAGLLPYGSQSALAASQTWNGASPSGNWSNTANWAGGAAPGSTSGTTSTDIATFNTAVTSGTWGGSAGNPVVIDQSAQNIWG